MSGGVPARISDVLTPEMLVEAAESLWRQGGVPTRIIVHPSQLWPLRWALRWAYHTNRLRRVPSWWYRLPGPLWRWALRRRYRKVDRRFAAWLKAHPDPRRR